MTSTQVHKIVPQSVILGRQNRIAFFFFFCAVNVFFMVNETLLYIYFVVSLKCLNS